MLRVINAPFCLRLLFCSFLSHFLYFFFSSLSLLFFSLPLPFRQLSSSSLRVQRTNKLFHKWLAIPTSTCLLKVYTGRKEEKSINAMNEMGGCNRKILNQDGNNGVERKVIQVVDFWHL